MTHVKKEHFILTLVIGVVLIVAAYMLGVHHGSSKSAVAGGQYGPGMMGGTRTGRTGFNMRGAGFLTGTVLSKDASSITVKLADGSTKIVLYSGTTSIMHTTAGTADDIAVGAMVSVQGAANSDGSTTATSIQLRPAGQGGPAGGAPTQAPMMPAAAPQQ